MQQSASKRRQNFLIFVSWLCYLIAQLGRNSFTANVTLIMDKYSVGHAAAGLVSTLFFLCYGGGQIVHGLLCNKYNRRIVLTFALAISGVINLLVYLGIGFAYIKYLWAVNGLVQSSLWVLLLLTLGQELDKSKLSFAAFIMSTASSGGKFLSYGLCTLFTAAGCFEMAFLSSALLLFIVAVLWFTTDNYKHVVNAPDVQVEEKQNTQSTDRAIPKNFIVLLIMFAFFSLVSYAVSGGLHSWTPSILKDTFGLPDWLSIFLSVFLAFCSLFNALISTWIYKKTGNFMVECLVCFLISCILLLPAIFFLEVSCGLTLVIMILLCLSTGVITNALTVQAPLFLKNDKVNSGFLAGILNGSCYIGNALSTYVLGVIADKSEWNSIFVLFMVMCLVSVVLCVVACVFNKKKI